MDSIELLCDFVINLQGGRSYNMQYEFPIALRLGSQKRTRDDILFHQASTVRGISRLVNDKAVEFPPYGVRAGLFKLWFKVKRHIHNIRSQRIRCDAGADFLAQKGNGRYGHRLA